MLSARRRASASALVIVLAAIVVVGIFAVAPAAAHRGPIPKYSYGEGCHKFIDPIGILFYGREASATRSRDLSTRYYDGMKGGTDATQFAVTHGRCVSTQTSVDDGCGACPRTHMRIAGLRNSRGRYHRDGKRRIYSVGTPHTDILTACPTRRPIRHANPKNGFRDARRRFVAVFRRAGHRVTHQRVKNTRRRKQCDGNYAQGDGLVAKIVTER